MFLFEKKDTYIEENRGWTRKGKQYSRYLHLRTLVKRQKDDYKIKFELRAQTDALKMSNSARPPIISLLRNSGLFLFSQINQKVAKKSLPLCQKKECPK